MCLHIISSRSLLSTFHLCMYSFGMYCYWLHSKKIDMEKLAEGLQQLHEDDLLDVIKIVHENKSSETYTKNDPERKSHHHHHDFFLRAYLTDSFFWWIVGEFHVDLYTLPDSCLRMLWDYTASKVSLWDFEDCRVKGGFGFCYVKWRQSYLTLSGTQTQRYGRNKLRGVWWIDGERVMRREATLYLVYLPYLPTCIYLHR